MIQKLLLLTCLALLVATGVAAQNPEAASLPETQAGRRVAAYIQAFNSGDEQKMREFLATNVSPAALQQRPLEARLQVYRNMHARVEGLELRRVLKSEGSSVSGLFRTKSGEWVEIGFEFEPESPHFLRALRVEDAEAPNNGSAEQTANAAPTTPLTEAGAVSSIESLLNEKVAADEFSGTVLVTRDGKPVFQKAYGLASKQYNVPNRLDTKFNIGSINKVFTQIAIGQLVEAGKLSYDDKLGKLLPDYPNRDAAEGVTLRQLLSMTSGIGDFFGPKFEATPKNQLRGIKDYLPLFASEPLAFRPGTDRRYSNGGYIVLGAIIEKATGQSYYDYVREHVFKPAGMTDTDWYEADMLPSNTASGYTHEGAPGARRQNIYSLPARGSSAGGGYSTAEDFFKFTLALKSGKLRMANFEPGQSPSGTAASPGGTESFGVAGGAPGLNAVLETGVGRGYTVVVMSNYDPPSAEKMGKQIRQVLGQVKN